MKQLVQGLELVVRGAAITFLAVWTGTQKFDLNDLKYAGLAAVGSAATSALALLTNGRQSVTFAHGPGTPPVAPPAA